MRKQELFIIAATLTAWFMTLGGKAFVGLLFFQVYSALFLPRIFTQFQWIRIPFITSLLLFFSLFLNKTKKIYYSRQFKLMVFFYIIMILSRSINGVDVFDDATEYMDIFFKLIFAHILVTNLIDNKDRLKCFLWIITISSATLSFLSRYKESTQAFGWMDKNDFAAILVSASAYPIMFALYEKKMIRKGEPIFYFVVLIYGIIGSASRGALLALGVVFFLILMTNFSFKRLLLILVILVPLLVRTAGTYLENFQSLQQDAVEQSGTGGQRLGAWLTAIEVIKDKPILGIGPGEFANNYLRYATAEARQKVGEHINKTNTHNTILQITAETGFVGLSIFLLIVFFSYSDIIGAYKRAKQDPALKELSPMIVAVGVTLSGYLAAGVFLNYGYNLQLYTLIALVVVCKNIVVSTSMETVANTEQEVSADTPYAKQLAMRSLLFTISVYICLKL